MSITVQALTDIKLYMAFFLDPKLLLYYSMIFLMIFVLLSLLVGFNFQLP